MRQRAFIVTDLGYGDAGKGTTVDFLTVRYGGAVIVRHNGGAQAGHNVVTPDGRHHTFAQFGSGMVHPCASTYLSRYMVIDPLLLCVEAQALDALGVSDVRTRTIVDPEALIATPFHGITNRVRERMRDARHGSCGLGIGEAVADSLAGCAIRAGDLRGAGTRLRALLASARARQMAKLAEMAGPDRAWGDYATLSEIAMLTSDTVLDALCARFARFAGEFQIGDGRAWLRAAGTIIFEGAQGVLLDEWYGFHPHTTWSTTTSANALAVVREADLDADVVRLGIVRTYMTRHGAGPLVTECPRLMARLREPHNRWGEFQGAFRYGVFDVVALRYALAATAGADALVVTHCDVPQDRWDCCPAYAYDVPTLPPQFDGVGREVTGIRLTPNREDLATQERLTGHLRCCTPVVATRTLPPGADGRSVLCSSIAELLGVPVALASWGPTVYEKTVLSEALCGRPVAGVDMARTPCTIGTI